MLSVSSARRTHPAQVHRLRFPNGRWGTYAGAGVSEEHAKLARELAMHVVAMRPAFSHRGAVPVEKITEKRREIEKEARHRRI